MDNIGGNNKNGNVKWITALCLTAVLAIIGWTTTANLAFQMKTMEETKAQSTENVVRISVLENQYQTIQDDLKDIKLILQKLRDDK